MNISHSILAIAWIVYCVLHSILAAGSIKAGMEKWWGRHYRYYRLAYTLFAFAGLVTILLYQVSIPSPLMFNTSSLTQWTGITLCAAGAALVMLNIIKYFVQLSGIRWLVTQRPEVKLERGGLHRYVRHPLYLSTFVFIWSLWMVYPYLSLFIANVVITLYTLIALRFEEKKLLAEFGEEYRMYQREVPMIIPGTRRRGKSRDRG